MVSFVAMKCEDDSLTESEKNGGTPGPDDNLEMADADDAEMRTTDEDQAGDQATGRLKRHQKRYVAAAGPNAVTSARTSPQVAAGPGLEPDAEELDEETIKRILACKRLSEGSCNRHLANLNICRKNSLHMIGESLPPVTEGEPMRHMSHHMSQNIENSQSSSTSSSSLRGGGGARHLSSHKRNSQDENTTSCSSSTSLDGSGPRSPTRRRSSTVSQCSSVLSEGTRQQLNFDLSPDLPPDSSILEANAVSPTDSERPASPEPSSLGSADGSFDLRPISRMSQFCDDLLVDAASPDSTLGDSTDTASAQTDANVVASTRMLAMQHQRQFACSEQSAQAVTTPPPGARATSEMMTSESSAAGATSIADNLERIITHVSEVKVSSNASPDPLADSTGPAAAAAAAAVTATAAAGQKRAHTPFGASIQRNKSTHIESTG